MYNIIKNLTIEDLVKIIISQHNDLYEIDEKEIDEEVYTINELLEKYKIFTRYNL